MKVVRIDGEVLIFRRLDVEFAPKCVDIFLLIVDSGVFHHMKTGGRMGTIGAYEEVEVDCNFARSISVVLAFP